MKPKLSRGAAKIIDTKIEEIFEKLKHRALGPQFGGKSLYITFQRPLSLPGIYEQAATEEGGTVDREMVDRLIEITNDYLDHHKSVAKAQIKKKIGDFLQEVDDGKRSGDKFKTILEGELSDVWSKVTMGVKKVLETETQHAQVLGIKEGIDQINARLGVDDPVVFWVPVRDSATCLECLKIHLLPDGVTPRCWLTSEVESGYHVKGNDRPSWSLIHPHCRCGLGTLLPNFGFSAAGRVTFKGEDWDELKYQRNI